MKWQGPQPPARQDRPKCKQCGASLKPRVRFVYDHDHKHTGREWVNGILGYGDGENLFCTVRCGYLWAMHRVLSDGRMKKPHTVTEET